MATKTKPEDSLTIQAPPKEEGYTGPRVRIFLPKLEDEGNGVAVDQYEHVTIANEQHEEHFRIHRGEWVDIPANVFVVMKAKHPNL